MLIIRRLVTEQKLPIAGNVPSKAALIMDYSLQARVIR